MLTTKDAVLKEAHDCILQNEGQRGKDVNHYKQSYWRHLHVRSGCVCIDEKVAIPISVHEAVLEFLHLTHPGSWGMNSLVTLNNLPKEPICGTMGDCVLDN